MKSFAAILFLACAVSGQMMINPWGINNGWNGVNWNGWNGARMDWNGVPVNWDGARMDWNAPVDWTRATVAAPLATPVPMAYSAPAVMAAPMVSSSQYHAQDELGQASFGYAHPGQAASNFRDAMGNQVGSYAYVNPEGKEVKVSYVADSLGFRVLSNDLPVAPIAAPVAALPMPIPVSDTIEVLEAKNAHMAAIEAARSGVIAAPVMIGELPKPVEDTPEVAAAKAEHMAAKAAVSTRSKRQIPLMNALPYGYANTWMRNNWMPYSAPVISAPAVRDATLTNIVHTPGHAMSYRVD